MLKLKNVFDDELYKMLITVAITLLFVFFIPLLIAGCKQTPASNLEPTEPKSEYQLAYERCNINNWGVPNRQLFCAEHVRNELLFKYQCLTIPEMTK